MRDWVKATLAAGLLAVPFAITACDSPADRVSHNLSVEADNFKIMRRVVFYNGITGKYMLEIDGLCSLGNSDQPGELSVTCKTGFNKKGQALYKKHFLGLSANVTYFVQQLDAAHVSADRYKVIWNPAAILPDIDITTNQTNEPAPTIGGETQGQQGGGTPVPNTTLPLVP